MSGARRARRADLRGRDVVLLDAGGTLVTLDYDAVREALPGDADPPDDDRLDEAEALARAWADAGVREKLGSRALWDGYFRRLLERAGVEAPGRDGTLERLWTMNRERGLWRRPVPGARDVLERLSAAGLRLAVVSNAEGQVEADLRAAGFGPLLETVVDSHLVGVAKPDPRIFEIALGRLGASPGRAVHVGDVPAFDVAGARAAGVEPILLDPHGVHKGADAVIVRGLDELPALLLG